MIVDAHTHLYPPHVYQDPAKWAQARTEAYWLDCVLPSRGPLLQGWATVDQLLADMDAAGIEKAVVLAWYWEFHDSCEENFHWQLEWVQAHPDRLIAFAPFNAKGGQRALDLLRRAFDAGFRGIGELNPPAQGYAYEDPFLSQALDLAGKAKALVNIHVTDPESRPYPGKIDTPFEALMSLAEGHPETRFIFSHLGGLMPLRGTQAALPNIWYDTSAVPLLYPPSIYREMSDKVGSERIVFGTDYPLRVFPRLEKAADLRTRVEALRISGLEPHELESIFSGNMKSLLEIQ